MSTISQASSACLLTLVVVRDAVIGVEGERLWNEMHLLQDPITKRNIELILTHPTHEEMCPSVTQRKTGQLWD